MISSVLPPTTGARTLLTCKKIPPLHFPQEKHHTSPINIQRTIFSMGYFGTWNSSDVRHHFVRACSAIGCERTFGISCPAPFVQVPKVHKSRVCYRTRKSRPVPLEGIFVEILHKKPSSRRHGCEFVRPVSV